MVSNKNDLKLEDLIEIEFIQKIQDAFCDAFGFGAVTVNKEKTITKPSNFTDFCQKYTRCSELGQERCLACDLKGGNDAVAKDGPNIYKCHAGLYDFAVPIMLGNKHIGSILCGQILTEPPNEEAFRKYANEIGIDENQYIEALRKVQIMPKERLLIAAESMWLLANNLSKIAYTNYYLLKKNRQEIALRKIITLLNSTFDYEKILDIICEESLKFFNIQRAFIIEVTPTSARIIKDKRTSENILGVNDQISPDAYQKLLRFWSDILLSTEHIFSFDDVTSAELPKMILDLHLKTGIKAGCSAVIKKTKDYCSVIVLQEYTQKRHWSKDDLDFLSILAQQIALSFKQSDLYTSLLHQQQRERALIDNIPFSAWLKDKDGKYLTVNKAYLFNEKLAYKDVIGKTDFELFSNEKAAPKHKQDLEIVKNGKPIHFEEETVILNEKKLVEVYKSPVYDENKDIFAIAGLNRDISYEREVERIKSEFLSIISHELRTPLTSIKGSLGLILNTLIGEISEKVEQLLIIANNNSDRLLDLINDILDVEKLETGMISLEYNDVEINKIIDKAISRVITTAKKRNIDIIIENKIPEKKIHIDETKFLQAFLNILSNAVKFSNIDSQIIINVEYSNNQTLFKITNFGEKIKESNKNILFEKFFQEDSSDSRSKGGLGLGLNIAKLLIEKMNGEISFDSNDEKTTFFIKLNSNSEN